MQPIAFTNILNNAHLLEVFSDTLPTESLQKLDMVLSNIQQDFPEACYSLNNLTHKFHSFLTPQSTYGTKAGASFFGSCRTDHCRSSKMESLRQDFYISTLNFNLNRRKRAEVFLIFMKNSST